MDLESLRQRAAQGDPFTYLYFWGHKTSADGRVTKACFSQWYPAAFTIDGVVYKTAEHWMMAAKARLFGDDESLGEILRAAEPRAAKALGRKVKNFDETLWKAEARRLVTQGNVAKFGQHPELKAFLLGTGAAVLVEASPFDRIWGIGMKADDARACDPQTWQGQNLLGFALMDVRQTLESAR